MNVVLTRVNSIKTRPQNLHRGRRVIQSVLMNIGWLETTVSAVLLREKSKFRKGEMKFTTTPRKLSVKATPEPFDAVAVSNATARLTITARQLCRAAYGYRPTYAADTTGTSYGFPMRSIETIFNDRPMVKLFADWKQVMLLFTRFMSLASARCMFSSCKSMKSPYDLDSTYATKTTCAKRTNSICDEKTILYKSQTAKYCCDRRQRFFLLLLLFSSFSSLASARCMFRSGKAVKRPNNLDSTGATKTACAKLLRTITNVVMVLYKGQNAKYFPYRWWGMFGITPNHGWMFGIRIRTAIHADLLRQVVFFQLALHG